MVDKEMCISVWLFPTVGDRRKIRSKHQIRLYRAWCLRVLGSKASACQIGIETPFLGNAHVEDPLPRAIDANSSQYYVKSALKRCACQTDVKKIKEETVKN